MEETNLPRIVGATPQDVENRTHKVAVAARYATSIGSPTHVHTVARHLGDAETAVLAACDLVLACVDKQTPRSLLNRLAYESLMPVIDCGVGFRVDDEGVLIGDAGRVVIVGPGRPCLACWGHLDPVVLREEALPEEQRSALAVEGYIQGATVEQPAVMCFNGMIGNAAVIEVLRLIAGFSDGEVHRLAFSFSKATSGRNAIRGTGKCRICGWRE